MVYDVRMIRLILLIILFSAQAHAADLIGQAHIVDGDTISIGETKIRLHGIDAPEMFQTCQNRRGTSYRCGQSSKDALQILIGPRLIRCKGKTYDLYGRLLAVCYSSGIDLSDEMVRQGWAMAYRAYSEDYVAAEIEAQNAKRGLWAGEFEPPWEWRRRRK